MGNSLPADLTKLQTRFEHWRNTRQTRSPIPEDLLHAARALLGRYPASRICRACRLHPTSLHRRTKPAPRSVKPATSASQSAGAPPAAFYSLPPVLTAAECRLVLDRPDGARLTLVLPGLDATSLSSLCSDFLRS